MIVLTQTEWTVLSIFVCYAGACVGSFLNVCIYRIPREESIVWPGSHCPKCGKPIRFYDNVPILSYLVLRGRCRFCKDRISPRYVLVEALMAVLFLLIWLRYGLDPRTPVYMMMAAGLVLGTFVDFEHMIIPDRVTLGGVVAGLILSPLVPSLHGATTAWGGLKASLLGAVLGAGILWVVGEVGRLAFKKDAMGMGDVKLLGGIGALLGMQAVLFTIVISSLVGSVVGVSLICSKRKAWQSRIPYGPYIALAALLWILWGQTWWAWYIGWMAGENAAYL
jgi:leader peptidase (prepilin peptidase)/N-methyltransferase